MYYVLRSRPPYVENDEEGKRSGGCLYIKMSSYQYKESHCGDKTVVRSSYLHNGISYTGKMEYLYWINPQLVTSPSLLHMMVCTDSVSVTNVYERWAAPCDQQFTLSCVSKEHHINQLKDVCGLAPQWIIHRVADDLASNMPRHMHSPGCQTLTIPNRLDRLQHIKQWKAVNGLAPH